jgi:hypothetical protein
MISSRCTAAVIAGVTGIALGGCGRSPLTAARIEHAIAPTFANLVQAQITRVGLTPIQAPQIKVAASCYLPAGGQAGAGEWICTIIWSGPNGATLHDRYDVSVTTDGCYTATVDASESELGGPVVKTQDGRDIRNLLYTFDGCFDTT